MYITRAGAHGRCIILKANTYAAGAWTHKSGVEQVLIPLVHEYTYKRVSETM